MADRYPDVVKTWRGLLKQNFTSWPENPDPSRSDTHAWSAHPTADLLRIVAGIRPGAAGYTSVIIAPHLGYLQRLDAASAHANGLIRTRYARNADGLRVEIDLPQGLSGRFELDGQVRDLRSGQNRFVMRDPRR